jgi:hypothetical protein
VPAIAATAPLANRVRKDAESTSTEYFYFGSMIIAELNPANGQFTNYVFFNGARVARRDPSGNVFYYLTDQVHSTSVTANAAGTPQAESDYYPWGGELQILQERLELLLSISKRLIVVGPCSLDAVMSPAPTYLKRNRPVKTNFFTCSRRYIF